MTIVNFIFTKIQAERALAVEGKINIRNNVSIKDVSKQELDFGARKQPVLRFAFEFTSNYDPKIGSIKLEGELTYMDEDKKLDEIVKEWKKEKKIKKEISNEILNNILAKCNVEALIISKDINLPPPIPLPKLQEEIKP